MTDWLSLIVFFAICYGASFLGAAFTNKSIASWYDQLNKPAWTPSGGFIGTVWLILYALMAIAGWLAYTNAESDLFVPMGLFGSQLILNVGWSLLFFAKMNPKMAFVEVVVFWIFILMTMLSFLTIDVLAGVLFIPYLAWVSVASYLNYCVWKLNP